MPKALSIPASQFWEGNDGNWSTVTVRFGSGQKAVRVLPATSITSTWLVHEVNCDSDSNVPDMAKCEELRGGALFQNGTSASWKQLRAAGSGNEYVSLPYTDTQRSLGYASNADSGLDTICIGDSACQDGNRIEGVIAAYVSDAPYVGMLGLSSDDNHIDAPRASPLRTLFNEKKIPSMYYAYTAGARYKMPPTFASLTLGGYDAARGNAEGRRISASLGSDSTRELLVAIKSIEIGAEAVQGLDTSIVASIDSLLPEIRLPLAACQSFESAFGLVWNETVGYYLVNDTQHDTLLQQDRSVIFTLSANASSVNTTQVTLPYSAFDLGLQYPLANISDYSTTQRYFPLQRANGPEQIVLGRTFLQEAYIAVDYEEERFWVSQATFPDANDENIVSIRGSDDPTLSTGAVVGIAVGATAIVIMIFGALFWLWYRRRKSRRQQVSLQSSVGDLFSRQSIAGTTINETPQNMEYFKPDPPPGMSEHAFKPELDATVTARGPVTPYHHRHELSAGSVRRTSQQTGISRATISPIEHRHTRSISYGSSMGQPSPHADHSPSAAGHPSPPMSDRGISWFSSTGPFYELHANEEAMRNGQSGPGLAQDVDLEGSVADPEEATLPPAQMPAPLRTPPQASSPTERPPCTPPVDRSATE